MYKKNFKKQVFYLNVHGGEGFTINSDRKDGSYTLGGGLKPEAYFAQETLENSNPEMAKAGAEAMGSAEVPAKKNFWQRAGGVLSTVARWDVGKALRDGKFGEVHDQYIPTISGIITGDKTQLDKSISSFVKKTGEIIQKPDVNWGRLGLGLGLAGLVLSTNNPFSSQAHAWDTDSTKKTAVENVLSEELTPNTLKAVQDLGLPENKEQAKAFLKHVFLRSAASNDAKAKQQGIAEMDSGKFLDSYLEPLLSTIETKVTSNKESWAGATLGTLEDYVSANKLASRQATIALQQAAAAATPTVATPSPSPSPTPPSSPSASPTVPATPPEAEKKSDLTPQKKEKNLTNTLNRAKDDLKKIPKNQGQSTNSPSPTSSIFETPPGLNYEDRDLIASASNEYQQKLIKRQLRIIELIEKIQAPNNYSLVDIKNQLLNEAGLPEIIKNQNSDKILKLLEQIKTKGENAENITAELENLASILLSLEVQNNLSKAMEAQNRENIIKAIAGLILLLGVIGVIVFLRKNPRYIEDLKNLGIWDRLKDFVGFNDSGYEYRYEEDQEGNPVPNPELETPIRESGEFAMELMNWFELISKNKLEEIPGFDSVEGKNHHPTYPYAFIAGHLHHLNFHGKADDAQKAILAKIDSVMSSDWRANTNWNDSANYENAQKVELAVQDIIQKGLKGLYDIEQDRVSGSLHNIDMARLRDPFIQALLNEVHNLQINLKNPADITNNGSWVENIESLQRLDSATIADINTELVDAKRRFKAGFSQEDFDDESLFYDNDLRSLILAGKIDLHDLARHIEPYQGRVPSKLEEIQNQILNPENNILNSDEKQAIFDYLNRIYGPEPVETVISEAPVVPNSVTSPSIVEETTAHEAVDEEVVDPRGLETVGEDESATPEEVKGFLNSLSNFKIDHWSKAIETLHCIQGGRLQGFFEINRSHFDCPKLPNLNVLLPSEDFFSQTGDIQALVKEILKSLSQPLAFFEDQRTFACAYIIAKIPSKRIRDLLEDDAFGKYEFENHALNEDGLANLLKEINSKLAQAGQPPFEQFVSNVVRQSQPE